MRLVVVAVQRRRHQTDDFALKSRPPRFRDLAPASPQVCPLPGKQRVQVGLLQAGSIGPNGRPALSLGQQRSERQAEGRSAEVRAGVLTQSRTEIAFRPDRVGRDAEVQQ